MSQEIRWRGDNDDSLDPVNDTDHPLPVQIVVPLAKQAATQTHSRLATGTDLILVRPGPGVLQGWYMNNHAATERLIRFYDKASAPVVASDASLIKWRVVIPATATGAGTNVSWSIPIPFFFGIAYSITTVVTSDTDGTAATAGDVAVNLVYT